MAEKSFGDRLTQLRESKGYLQRDVASRMGVKANTISNWEKGISRPNLDQLCQLCQILCVTSDTLLGLDKSAMERTLNQMEQRIIGVYRSLDHNLQKCIHEMFFRFGRINASMIEKSAVVDTAESFIKSAGLQDDWQELLQITFPQDIEEENQEGEE